MLIFYNFGIHIYHLLIIIYQFFNQKAKLWIDGRKNIFAKIAAEVDSNQKSIWFHFASLGEFEQGRPVIELLRKLFPKEKIIITFFSPSGYELRKNYKHADHIFYLPLDTNKNAKKFVKLINPKLAIFTKYEFWYHYFNELNNKSIPIVVISAIFRPNQVFFKWYGNFNKKILRFVNHFFVQDENSRKLLSEIHLNNVTVSGDTRFDRVLENTLHPPKNNLIERFSANSKTFIAGSTWPQDEKLIIELINLYPEWKFIIAPHEIKEEKINLITTELGSELVARYSGLNENNFSKENNLRVLVIDNIGMLSSLYQYGQIAYIGGGFGVGIHNTLEAAAFGLPVIFGPNYEKFREAKELIKIGAGFSISNSEELKQIMQKLSNDQVRLSCGEKAKQYVQKETGATDLIMKYLQKLV